MELIASEFGQLKVLYRHPDFKPEDLAPYIDGNVPPPDYVFELPDPQKMEIAMWRGVTDYRYDHKLTSWASTEAQASYFLHMGMSKPEMHRVKHRELATVIAMVLHEWDSVWIEYVVID